jgi:hypothetical protein
MTAFEVQYDGSLLFAAPVAFVSSNYSLDPNNPCRYIPKYDPCGRRRLELKVLPCGKRVAGWTCDLFKQSVSVAFCRVCGVSDDVKQG